MTDVLRVAPYGVDDEAPPVESVVEEASREVAQVAAEVKAEYDLPELSGSADEADARTKMNAFLRACGGIDREFAANEAEYKAEEKILRERHTMRQERLAKHR